MSTQPSYDSELILRESAWLRRLAVQLVRDPAAADEAAQTALVAWLGRPRGAGRGWLRAVLRNVVRQDHRAAARRTHHEQRAARPEATSEAVHERLEVQRRLVDALQELREPYRTTLALRFFEELPPREIARRTETKIATVRTRLERGLAQLRASLDEGPGGRESWLSALLPFALPKPAPALSIGILAMGTTWKLIGISFGLLACAWWAQGLGGRIVLEDSLQPELAPGEAVALVGESQGPSLNTAENEADSRTQRFEALGLSAPEEEAPSAIPLPTFRGRVVDLQERPIGGLRVVFEATTEIMSEPPAQERWTTSEEDGSFEMPIFAERGRLSASGSGRSTVVAAALAGVLPVETPTIVVAEQRTYLGRVFEENGAPVEGAQLAVSLPVEQRRQWHPGALSGILPFARATSAADGSFELQAGFADGARVRVSAPGFADQFLELPEYELETWLIELERAHGDGTHWAGRVVDSRGEAVPGAWVSGGWHSTTCDDSGEFRLPVEGAEGAVLRAVAEGYLPAELSLAGMPSTGLILTLGGTPRRLSGRVVTAKGQPVPGARVWTVDGRRFGRMPTEVGELTFLGYRDLEEVVAGRDGRSVLSDEKGRFELTGLLVGNYRLQALHPVTLQHVLVEAPSGSSDIELSIPFAGPKERLAGRVVTNSGDPVAGVQLELQRPMPSRFGGTLPTGFRESRVVSDEAGRFELEGYRLRELSLRLEGSVLASGESVPLATVTDLEDLEVRVPAEAHLRVVVEDEEEFTGAFSLLDASGKPLDLSTMVGSVHLGAQTIRIEAGRSGLVRADDSAALIVLYDSRDEELRRVPVRLRAGEVTVVHP